MEEGSLAAQCGGNEPQLETSLVRRAAVPINEAKREVTSQASPDATPRTSLRQLAYVTALRQYLQLLAGGAQVKGVNLDAAAEAVE